MRRDTIRTKEEEELDLRHQVARQETRKVESRRALQRLTGSYLLGAISVWKLLTFPTDSGYDLILAMWVGVALLAFGLASFDQVAKIFKR